MVDPPRTEAAMAAALPLAGVPAWRVYLGLPMFGARTPAGGLEEVMRLGAEDFVLKLFRPVVEQAAAEAPAAVAAFRAGLRIGDAPILLVGGSTGTAVALLLLAEGELPVAAAALVSPVSQLAPAARCFDATYRWTDESRAVADRFDFVARAGEIARRHPQPPMLLVTGERDLAEFREPAAALHAALRGRYADPERVGLVSVPEMAHALAEAPGIQPAPQTRDAERVDTHVTEWLRRHLGG
jgi:alpha-beta hydrolase superfamily lysophospholipase